MQNFNLNDFYDNLGEAFQEMELEYVDKEEYINAKTMFDARKPLMHEKEIYNLLDGNNIGVVVLWTTRQNRHILRNHLTLWVKRHCVFL